MGNFQEEDQGEIEMMKNHMRLSKKDGSQRKMQLFRERGRTIGLINKLQIDNSNQTVIFKRAINRTKRLKELEAKIKSKRGHCCKENALAAKEKAAPGPVKFQGGHVR